MAKLTPFLDSKKLTFDDWAAVAVEYEAELDLDPVGAACRRCEYEPTCTDRGIERSLCPKNRRLRGVALPSIEIVPQTEVEV